MEKLIYLPQSSHQIGAKTRTHIGTPNGVPLCAYKKPVKEGIEVTWDNLHYETPYEGLCETCQKKAKIIFRPKAKFWYMDPFNDDIKEFDKLNDAENSAIKEHGNSTIWQTGPGDINKIIEIAEGLNPLP